ncbi:unnamed protein product [Trichobilharzia regenti]|nr:unnamed protein product [Trichobilharzia regenti]
MFGMRFVGMVDRFTVDGGTLEELEEVFNDQAYSDYYVVFLRLLVSAYIQKKAAYFVNFIDEGKTINQFCETILNGAPVFFVIDRVSHRDY